MPSSSNDGDTDGKEAKNVTDMNEERNDELKNNLTSSISLKKKGIRVTDNSNKSSSIPKDDDDVDDKSFICGVVEGFYGRPWTLEQRKDLFSKMHLWGLNSYLYAPKDDCKHRVYWRELYTVEEADHLVSLINLAHENNIDFYYAISPGLDITYSNPKDIACLKRKIEQVSQLGCKAFALLFDDIEPEMSKQDKEAFQSFGHAQVSVTNEVFEHFNHPKFLFCPTQYCTTRAFPTVLTSEYLNTIGTKLSPNIKVMWTGDKVISKIINEKTLEDINQVLRRPIVIWDNLHANDYDSKRVFLGPFSGRTPSMINKISGVMTNPNCEYGANFIAIHTLAQWSKCSVDGESGDISPDIKLEIENESNSAVVVGSLPDHIYHPQNALRYAIKDWKEEFSKPKNMWGPLSKPQVSLIVEPSIAPIVNTCLAFTPTITSQSAGAGEKDTPVPSPLPMIEPPSVSTTSLSQIIPGALPIMNSLVDSEKVVVDIPGSLPLGDSNSNNGGPHLEPMEHDDTQGDVAKSQTSDSPMESFTGPSTPASIMQQEEVESNLHKTESSTMLCDEASQAQEVMSCDDGIASRSDMRNSSGIPQHLICTDINKNYKNEFTEDDLLFMCQLFFLSAEHGQAGLDLLSDFFWLKRNGRFMQSKLSSNSSERTEWEERAERFISMCQTVRSIFLKLVNCPNRELVYDLYTYFWDIYTVTQSLEAFVVWISKGIFSFNSQNFVGGQTWFSGIREAFLSGDYEPWVFRGGLVADLQRLLPLESASDLYGYKHPDVPTSIFYRIRPFEHGDSQALFTLASERYSFSRDSNLISDKYISPILTLSSSHCFVAEAPDKQVIGYCLGIPDYLEYVKRYNIAYIPEMIKKYSDLPQNIFDLPITPSWINNEEHNGRKSPWGFISLHVNRFISEQSLTKRLLTILLAALRSSGTFRTFVRLSQEESSRKDECLALGFSEYARVPIPGKEKEEEPLSTDGYTYLIRFF